MNPKIERIEEAEKAIETVIAEKETLRDSALQDGVIDAKEQADLDRVDAKIEKLRDIVRTLRATVENNRRIWDALAPSLKEWTDQLVALHEVNKPNLGAFDTTENEMTAAVKDQRWEDATIALKATMVAMKPVYAAYQAEAAMLAGVGIPVPQPAAPTADPDQDQWNSALTAHTDALTRLQRHTKAAHAHVAGLITAIKASETAAKADAAAGKYSDGTTKLRASIDACAAAEDAAHDVAHYDATHGHRQGLVATNAGSPVGDPLVDDLQTEMETLLTAAEADATAGKHKDAIPKLDKIAPLFDRHKVMADRQSGYSGWEVATQGLANTINGKPAAERASIQARLDRANTDFAAAKIAVTKDYTVSSGLMKRLNAEFFLLFNILKDAKTYTADLKKFDNEMALLKPHAGRIAVEEFYQAKIVDRAQVLEDFAVPNLNAALALMKSTTAAEWTAAKTTAAEHKTYMGNRTTAQAQIETVRAMPDTADLIAQADALMATAATQAIAKDIKAAEASVAEALVRANDAQKASQAQAALGALNNTAALDAVAADFPAALDVYTKMRANVAGQDTGGIFAAALTAADVPVDAAKASVAGGSPDMADVRKKLDEGIAAVEAVLPQVIAHGHFQAHLATAKTLITGLPAKNHDDCIKKAIEACDALIVEAETLAKSPTFNFVGAEAKVSEAQEKGRQAEANAAIYKPIVEDGKNNITAALANISSQTATIAGYLTASVKRLNDLSSDITAAVAAEDFALAKVKGQEATVLANTVGQDVTMCTTIAADYTRFVTNPLPRVQGATPEAVTALAAANKKIAEFNAQMAAGAYRLGLRLISEINWAIFAGDRAIKGSAKFGTAQTSARNKLDAVVAKRNAGIEDALKALETRYTAAVALGAEPQHEVASAKMAEIGTEADELLKVAEAFGVYETARAAAEAKLVEAENHEQIDAIQAVVTLLRTKYDGAVQMATDGNPTRAEPLMKEVESGADDALSNAASAKILAGFNDTIGGMASETSGPNFVAIAAARAAYEFQEGKANAAVAKEELAEADTKLKLAEDDATADADKTIALRSAMDLTTKAGQVMSQHSLLKQAIDRARARTVSLRGHAQSAYLDAQLKEMEDGIDAVEAKATSLAAMPGCTSDLETIMADAGSYLTKMDAQAKYGPLRASPEVEPQLLVLEQHTHSYAIQPNIETMRSKLADAKRLSENFDPVPAVALLEEVKKIGLSALVLAKMQANTPPTKAELEDILARPGGDAELDAMVDTLEPDAQRAVLSVAFEARFGCTLQSLNEGAATALAGGVPGPNIRRFYEIMSDLPSSAVVDNDSLKLFQELENAAGASDYTGGATKRISMRAGDAEMSPSKVFGAEHEVGIVEKDCEPANRDPVNKFSWSTLHEVGHAVDDQHGFMDKREGVIDFGGWTTYGGNVDPIATIVAAHFEFDKTYIAQVMSGRIAIVNAAGAVTTAADLPPSVPEPKGCGAEEWESRRVKFANWVERVRTGKKPWDKQSTAAQIAIDGIVYHECYNTDWVSYPLAARSRGITAYQFRAPGEWFSELYAAYHSGKLKDTHPAAKWLADLDAPSP